MALLEQIYPRLAPMQRASRAGRLYTGPCPFCADGGNDRFHVWMEASGGRPAERYWCRVCNRRGLLRNLNGDNRVPSSERRAPSPLTQHHAERPEPNPA